MAFSIEPGLAFFADRYVIVSDGPEHYLGTTDSHTYTIDPICGRHFTLLFAKSNESEDIMAAVRERNTVAVQILDKENVLCFGSPRHSMFAQFYVKEIFEEELCRDSIY